MPTLADIAKIAGVGVMSVSRVVNGTRRVSPEVERKVRAAVAKIGYEPNEAARILKGTKSSVIGLIVPDLADPFFSTCCNVIQRASWSAGYMTVIAASDHREDHERRVTEVMLQRRVAGMIVVPIGTRNDHFAIAQKAGVPLVAFDRPLDQVHSDTLVVDNCAASARATRHLIDHGHKNILCIADDERIHTKTERVAGYLKAMKDARLTPHISIVGSLMGSVAEQLSASLNSPVAPTAIFAASNIVGLEVLSFLQQKRIKIPQRIALVCFDDFSAATLVSPSVTVVQQPVVEMGQRAANVLLERLDGRLTSGPKRIELATQLLIRKSCGC